MKVLACVLFKMDACNADALNFAVYNNFHIPMLAHRKFILGYLVPFGQVWIKIILAGEPAIGVYRTMCGNSGLDDVLHCFFVQYRQHSRHSNADWAGTCICFLPEPCLAPAEYFGI